MFTSEVRYTAGAKEFRMIVMRTRMSLDWLYRTAVGAFLTIALVSIAGQAATFANGYEDNPPRIVWSPAGNVLVGVVNDELWIVDVLGYADILESGGVSSPTFSQDGLYLAFIQNGELKVYDWMLSEYVETEAYGDVTDCSFDRAEDDEQASHFLYFTSAPLYS